MIPNLLDRTGNWNPQLFREIKGRLKVGNMAIASAFSLGGQLLLFLYFNAKIPVISPEFDRTKSIYNRFCILETAISRCEENCARDALGNLVINWPQWWIEIFAWLSIFGVLVLLVAGTYLLVSDLSKEERRGTLNFIRLSPQSAKTIFLGKILGVPILLYLAAILALPLHLYSGLAAQIPLYKILCFYIAVPANCSLFYSAAIVFGITNSWLRGFESWFASFVVLLVYRISSIGLISSATWDLLTFLSPIALLKYMFYVKYNKLNAFHFLAQKPNQLQWFHLPIGTNIASGLALFLLICGTGTYWMYQGWQRRFLNPSATILSKWQSCLLIICCEAIVLGFAIQFPENSHINMVHLHFNIIGLLSFNLLIFLALMVAAKVPPKSSAIDYISRSKRLRVYEVN